MTTRTGLRLVASLVLVGAVLWFARFQSHTSSLTAEPFCPSGSNPNPNAIWCEDFEDGGFTRRWSVSSAKDTWPASQFVECADNGFGFKDRCAAWTNRLVFDNEWGFYGYDARTSFPPQSELYIRWYQYVSDPYTWGSLEDKALVLHDRRNAISAYVGTSRNHLPTIRDSGPGVPFVSNYQDLDWSETKGQYTNVNRFQNQDRKIELQPGRWYLFEWYIKLNTPGASDGVTKLWIDDASGPVITQTLRMHYTDMRWLRSSDAGRQFDELRLTVYHQRCDGAPNTCPPNGPRILDQSHRWDRIVISRAPVGPLREAERRTAAP
jgi:hypothetical protein